MQMRAHRIDRQRKYGRDLLVTSFFLMIKHLHRTFHGAQLLQRLLHFVLKRVGRDALTGPGSRVRQAVFPAEAILTKRLTQRNKAALVLPFAPARVMRNIHDDAVQVGLHLGFSAKAGQASKEPQERFLRQVFHTVPAPEQAHQQPRHHLLVFGNKPLELGFCKQARLDLAAANKFQRRR